jgi:hypothetical protein
MLQVFERVAQPVVVSTLEGYNGTVFAYGQTGSGKTFTITGGAERYVDRGVIPRTISSIFKELSNRSDHTYQVSTARTIPSQLAPAWILTSGLPAASHLCCRCPRLPLC